MNRNVKDVGRCIEKGQLVDLILQITGSPAESSPMGTEASAQTAAGSVEFTQSTRLPEEEQVLDFSFYCIMC